MLTEALLKKRKCKIFPVPKFDYSFILSCVIINTINSFYELKVLIYDAINSLFHGYKDIKTQKTNKKLSTWHFAEPFGNVFAALSYIYSYFIKTQNFNSKINRTSSRQHHNE